MKYWKTLLLFVFFSSAGFCQTEFSEVLHNGWKQTFEISEWIVHTQSPFQKIQVFRTPFFGRVLALDDIVQITEKDEFVYQEMLAHVPLLAHGKAKDVLIIGGGDGAVLKEVLKHKTVQKAVLVDIDSKVMEISKQYLPGISQGAFDSPRSEIIVADGVDFVKKAGRKFDVIIVDTTDPIGPGEVLFSHDFFQGCKHSLKKNGIITIQNGVVFLQQKELKTTQNNLGPLFKNLKFYTAAVPTYVGGVMAFGFATDSDEALTVKENTLAERLQKNMTGSVQYYTPKIHNASFALPLWVERYLKSN